MSNNYPTEAGFPSFSSVFERAEGVPVPLYLTLLNSLTRDESQIAIEAVRSSVTASPNADGEVQALLADFNWRPHLVAAVAMLTGLVNPQVLRALWIALDSGSWVSPQLAVTAFHCDPHFEQEARQRIEAGCPLNTKRLEGMDWVVRHSAAGPISSADHSSKILASLVTMCRLLPDAAPWLNEALANENINAMLQGYTDGAEEIAAHWHREVEQAKMRTEFSNF